MKKLQELEYNYKDYADLLVQPVKTSLLLNSIKYKVFDHTKDFKSSQEIAQLLGTHLDNTGYFLDGLTACNFIIKKEGKYKNTEKTDLFLVSDSEYYLGKAIPSTYEWYRPVAENLPELLEKGPEAISGLEANSDELWKDVTRNFEGFQKGGYAQSFAKKIVSLPEFKGFNKMLDLGASAGLIGMYITDKHPSMKCVLLDKPMVAETTKEIVEEYQMTDRVEVLAADYLTESIGNGYDLIIACATLYFAKNNISQTIKKIFEALNPGGVFVSYHEGLYNENTQPAEVVLSWLGSTLTNQNMSYKKGELAQEMLNAGFTSVHSQSFNESFGEIGLDIARKL